MESYKQAWPSLHEPKFKMKIINLVRAIAN